MTHDVAMGQVLLGKNLGVGRRGIVKIRVIFVFNDDPSSDTKPNGLFPYLSEESRLLQTWDLFRLKVTKLQRETIV